MKTLMKRATVFAFLTLAPALAVSGTSLAETSAHQWAANPPASFVPPAIHPEGVRLQTRELAPGVYALLSGHGFVDNSGFVVGDRGVLVIDAHINADMARQIQAAVREVTDKPILYLVNTNYHGDHNFGNYAFPAETKIIAHRLTFERMRHFEQEKRLMLRTVNNDPKVFGDARLRLPDVTFEERLSLDLGGRVVELYHFGRGNTPGDTVVYQPDAKVAWTGNLVVGAGTIPPIFEGGAGEYLKTIARFAERLEVATIIPGHGAPATGAILGRYLSYLGELIETARLAARAGSSLEDTLAKNPLGQAYLPPEGAVPQEIVAFLNGLHQLNLQQTYREAVDRTSAAGEPVSQ